MKVVVLAGGMGARLAEETTVKPKPMVEIGDKPILWHILNIYAAHGHEDFLIALGYKGEMVKDYFLNYHAYNNDVTIFLANGHSQVRDSGHPLNWRIQLVDTGMLTKTGGRIQRLASRIGSETFMLTYGDGVGNMDIRKLLEFHRSHGKLVTITAVRPPARFGGLTLDGENVVSFSEKTHMGEGWINGGFFVLEPRALDYIDGDVFWEHAPLENLARDGQLMAYKHEGFWQPMDTLREKQLLQALWDSGSPPWKTW